MLTANGRVERDTLNDFIKGQTENLYLRNKLLAVLRQYGRVVFDYDAGGTGLNWLVKMDRGTRANRPDGANATFQRPDRRKTATLGWGKVESFEDITKGEELQNKGPQARVNLLQDILKSMRAEVEEDFCHDLMQDGATSTYEDPLYGLQSILGQTDGVAADYVVPGSTDTYAGLKMNPGGYGGAVLSGTWPFGQFDHKRIFWTPLQADYKRTAFGGGTSWAENGPKVLRRLIDGQTHIRGMEGRPDVFLVTAGMYTELKDTQDDKQRITVGKQKGLVSLGFSDVMEFDGVEVTSEPCIPDGMLMGLALSHVEIISLQKQLFQTDQAYVFESKTKQFSIDFWGQFKFNPWALCGAKNFT